MKVWAGHAGLMAWREAESLHGLLFALAEAGLTVKDICREVGVSRSTLYNWYRDGVPSGRGAQGLVALARKHGFQWFYYVGGIEHARQY